MYICIAVLRLVKDAQLQHGLRHDDYQRYRYVIDTRKVKNFVMLYNTLNITVVRKIG